MNTHGAVSGEIEVAGQVTKDPQMTDEDARKFEVFREKLRERMRGRD